MTRADAHGAPGHPWADHIPSDASVWLDAPGITVDGDGSVTLEDGYTFDLNDGAEPFSDVPDC